MGAMREILFRGKRKDNGKWVEGHYGEYYSGKEKVSCISISKETISGSLYYDVIPETVGQYTGLTDKNGSKIFEGDILHAAQGNFVVRWSESICSFVAGEKERMRPCMNSGTMKCCEVIGNIHDNPELIELDIHKAEVAESE